MCSVNLGCPESLDYSQKDTQFSKICILKTFNCNLEYMS